MKDIVLQRTLGNPKIDSVVQEVIQVYEDIFPGQIIACYIEGSYADMCSSIEIISVTNGHHCTKRSLTSARTSGSI